MNIREMYENKLYKEIVAYYERTHDLDNAKYVALSYKELKEHEKAFNVLTEALEICKNQSDRIEYCLMKYEISCYLYGRTDKTSLLCLGQIGIDYYLAEEKEKALKILQLFYDEHYKAYDDDELVCHTLTLIYQIVSEMQDYKARAYYSQLKYETFSKVYGYNDIKTLNALYCTALDLYLVNRYDESLLKAQQCFSLQKSILGLNNKDTLQTYYLIACNHFSLNHYQESYDDLLKCLKLRQELFGDKHPDVITTKEFLLTLCLKLEELKQCGALKDELLDYYQNTGQANKQVDLLVKFGNMYFGQKEYKPALTYYKEAYSLALENNMTNEYLMVPLKNTILCLMNLEEFNEEVKYCDVYKNKCIRQYGEYNKETIVAYEYLADCFKHLNDNENAYTCYEKCYELNKEVFGENHPDTFKFLLQVNFSLDNTDQRRYQYIKENFNLHKKYDLQGQEDLWSYYLMIGALVELGHLKEGHELSVQTYDMLESRDFYQKYIGYSTLFRTFFTLADYDMYFNCIKKYIDTVIDGFIHQMISQKKYMNLINSENEVYYQTLIFHFFQKEANEENYLYLIKVKNLLFSFERMWYLITKDETLQALIKETDSYQKKLIHSKVAQKKGIERKLHRLKEKKESIISNYIQDFNKVESCKLLRDALYEGECLLDFYYCKKGYGAVLIRKEGQSTYFSEILDIDKMMNDFVEKIEPYLKDVKHLYICPDGDLYNISFARYINTEISYLSSPQDLLEDYNESSDDDLDIVSVIYPDYYDESSESRGQKGVLYGSYIEGMYINQLFEDSTLLSRDDANHDNFLDIISPKILHISTHGEYVDSDQLMENGRLCLSGYNKTDSGYVTAAEIQDMDLTDTELVVLSACQTGQGKSIGGEGVYGIRRAFELAGAHTLLLTVEEIDDYNAALFMKIFYQYYKKSRNAMQSYQDTQSYLSDYQNGIKELIQFKEDFKYYLKEEIHPTTLKMKLIGIDNRIKECMTQKKMLKTVHGHYEEEDWKGFIIQGKVHV